MKLKRLLVFLVIKLVFMGAVFSQNERGLLPIYNYTEKDYEAVPQNWSVKQAQNGVVYIGNNIGLLEFKGANSKNEKWRLHPVSNGSEIRSIDINEKGHIFVGARGELGYFAPDTNSRGELIYYSLTEKIDSNFKENIFDIWHTNCSDEGVYFADNNNIFFYNYDTIIIKPIKGVKKLFNFKNKTYFSADEYGIAEIENGEVKTLENAKEFISENDDGKEYCKLRGFATVDENAFLMISDNSNSPLVKLQIKNGSISYSNFNTNINAYLVDNQINNIIRAGKYFILSMSVDGIIVLDENGNLIRVINQKSGLQDNKVRSAYFDDQNYLWVALNDGISRIKLYSSYTKFPQKISGFDKKIEKIVRFNGYIYASGSNGLFKLDQNISNLNNVQNSNTDLNKYAFSKFTQIEDEEYLPKGASVWGLKVFKSDGKEVLLASTNNYVLEIDKNDNIKKILNAGPWCFHIDKNDNSRVFMGLYQRGVGSIYWDGSKWIIEGRIGNLNKDILNIDQDDNGNLWLGRKIGTCKLDYPEFVNHKVKNPNYTCFNEKQGLPKNDAVYNRFFNGKMIFGTGDGMYTYIAESDTFVHVQEMGEWFGKSHLVFRMAIDDFEKIWSVVFSKDKKYTYLARTSLNSEGEYITNRLLVDESKIILAVYPEEDGTIWLGGTNGIFKLNESKVQDGDLPFRTYLNLVISNEDTLFRGIFYDQNSYIINEQTPNLTPTVKYENNNFEFHISSIGYNNEVPLKYSFFLEGNDEKWTNWDFNNFRRYTNLHEGDYTLKVKAKDIFGNVSDVTTYSFTVKPPWYRTILAYILYVLFFAAFVWAAITISTRSLRKIIREATAEIQKQKDELEEKNKNIMDSIRYAQRIQEAVLPSETKLKKYFPEHFVLFKPRDIVSGDFYWMMNKGNKNIIIAADCTGHGVPGAFMSIMGVSFLNEITNKKEVQTAAEVLNQLRANIINSLNPDDSENKAKDGMDISVCVYDFEEMTMQFAGAYNPLYMIRDGEISKVKADRMPVGVHERDDKAFINNVFEIKQGDQFYILSDGLIDQFGGPKGKKFMTKRFKKLLLDIHKKPMNEQKEIIDEENIKWRGDIEQIDDIIVIGVKVV